MIILQLLGGLGNQMFQYAAARRLASEKNVALRLDTDWFAQYGLGLRDYKLHHFNISAEIATPAEIAHFRSQQPQVKLRRFLERRLLPRHRRSLYLEASKYRLDPDFLRVPAHVYLHGYFQDEAYFKPIEPIIRQEFTLRTPLDAANLALAARIRSASSVSLHIRRGDYAANPQTLAYHGVLPLEYYQAAARRIAETVADPEYFVFSDDLDWAKAHLQLDAPATFVDLNDAAHDYADLYLLSQCRHHIIANSSFSWWGAWLCEHPAKQVFAPRQWLNDPSVDTSALVPAGWVRL